MKKTTIAVLVLCLVAITTFAEDDITKTIETLNSGEYQMSDIPSDFDFDAIQNWDAFITNENFDRSKLTVTQIQSLDQFKLRDLVNKGNGELFAAGKDSEIMKEYSKRLLGSPDILKINQPGAKVKANQDGSVELSFGTSGNIRIETFGSKDLVYETVKNPDTIKVTSTKGEMFLDLDPAASVSFDDGMVSVKDSQNREFPPVSPTGTMRISTKEGSMYLSDGIKTIEIEKAEHYRGDGAIKYTASNGGIKVDLGSYRPIVRDVGIGLVGNEKILRIDKGTDGIIFSVNSKGTIGIQGQFPVGTRIKMPGTEKYLDISSKEEEKLVIDSESIRTLGGVQVEFTKKYTFKKLVGKRNTEVLINTEDGTTYSANAERAKLTKDGRTTLATKKDPGLKAAPLVRTKGKITFSDRNQLIKSLPDAEGIFQKGVLGRIVQRTSSKRETWFPVKGIGGLYQSVNDPSKFVYRNRMVTGDLWKVKEVNTKEARDLIEDFIYEMETQLGGQRPPRKQGIDFNQ